MASCKVPTFPWRAIYGIIPYSLIGIEDATFWERQKSVQWVMCIEMVLLMSFAQCQEKFHVPNAAFYRYLLLRYGFPGQFPDLECPISQYSLTGILSLQGPRGLSSGLYIHAYYAPKWSPYNWWLRQNGAIKFPNQMIGILVEYPLHVSPSINNGMTQLFLFHQCYLSLLRLQKIGRLS